MAVLVRTDEVLVHSKNMNKLNDNWRHQGYK